MLALLTSGLRRQPFVDLVVVALCFFDCYVTRPFPLARVFLVIERETYPLVRGFRVLFDG